VRWMASRKRDIGKEILEGIREIKRGEYGRVTKVPSVSSIREQRRMRVMAGDKRHENLSAVHRRVRALRASS
jgi:hypothetical protein